jgi:hypothetical protein
METTQNTGTINAVKIAKKFKTTKELPPFGVVVKALCRCSRDWPKALGGSKVMEDTFFIKRIKTKSNAQGWHWSNSDIETYFTWQVVSWSFCE